MEGQPFSPKQLLDNAVANIICSLLFGNRYEYGDKEFAEIQHSTDKIFEFLGTSNIVCNFLMINSIFCVLIFDGSISPAKCIEFQEMSYVVTEQLK